MAGLLVATFALAGPGLRQTEAVDDFWSADRAYWAWVYTNRDRPLCGVPVEGLRFNRSPMEADGVQYVLLHADEGSLRIPFEQIDEIRIGRSLGHISEAARFAATVLLRDGLGSRYGRLELISMHGLVDQAPWHVLLTARDDRGANLYRIVFVDPDAGNEDESDRETEIRIDDDDPGNVLDPDDDIRLRVRTTGRTGVNCGPVG